MIRFTVPGDPVGKGRGRIGQANGKVWNVTPAKTRNYETMVRELATDAMADWPMIWDLACWVRIEIYIKPPVSWSQKRQSEALAGYWAPNHLDADNVAKAILDGMNGIVFTDDKRVCDLSVWKSYARTPGVFVEAGLI